MDVGSWFDKDHHSGADLVVIVLIYACSRLNNISRLAMMWTVRLR